MFATVRFRFPTYSSRVAESGSDLTLRLRYRAASRKERNAARDMTGLMIQISVLAMSSQACVYILCLTWLLVWTTPWHANNERNERDIQLTILQISEDSPERCLLVIGQNIWWTWQLRPHSGHQRLVVYPIDWLRIHQSATAHRIETLVARSNVELQVYARLQC